MKKSNNKERKKIILIFIIFGILALLIVFMLIKEGLLFNTQLRFGHKPITYSIEQGIGSNARVCSDAQVGRIDQAFEILTNETQGDLKFIKVNPGKGDILFYCAEIANGNLTYLSNSTFKVVQFAVTEGESQYSKKGNIIQKGVTTFYDHRNCGTFPDVEIHEILHIFGFTHSTNESSIMYPFSLVCDRDSIDPNIIKSLMNTYH